jgi:hypothetical protein
MRQHIIGVATLITLASSLIALFIVALTGGLEVSFTSTINRDGIQPFLPTVGFEGIIIYANITALEGVAFIYKAKFAFVPTRMFHNQPKLIKKLNQNVSLSIDSDTFLFQQYRIMKSQTVELSIESGNPNLYPFDTYQSHFFIEAEGDNDKRIPMSMSLTNSLGNWNLDILLFNHTVDSSVLEAQITMRRTAAQQFFSLFMVLIMWAMSLFIFLMSIGHLWYSRRVEASTIGVVTSMLFALPAVRNMLPGAPPIGCTTDVVGFFWNMGLVAAAGIQSLTSHCVTIPLYISRKQTIYSSSTWSLHT